MQSNNEGSNKSISLWESFGKIRELVDAIDSAEEIGHGSMVDAFVGDIMALLKDAEGGVDRCVGFVKYADAENAAIDAEIDRLKAMKKRNERSQDRIKSLAMALMETLGMERLEGKFERSFAIRESTAVRVLALDQVPDDFKRVTTSIEPNKSEILKELRAGRAVAGCELETRKSVVVK